MSSDYWTLGLGSSLVLCSVLFAALLARHRLLPILNRRLPRRVRAPPLPDNTFSRIIDIDSIQRDHDPAYGESCEWLNALAAWISFNLTTMPKYSRLVHLAFARLAVDMRRGLLGHLLKDSELVDFETGENVPLLANARLVCDGHRDVPLTLGFDFDYDGGVSGIVRLELVGDFQVHLMAHLSKLCGPVFVAFKEKALYVSWHRFRDLRFEGRVFIQGREFSWINWIFARIVLPWLAWQRLEFPRLRGKWLFDKASHVGDSNIW